MSSRITSQFGSLGDRVGPQAPAPDCSQARHIEVFCDPFWQPELLVRWARTPEGWRGLCALVAPDDDQLRVGLLPADRFRPTG